MDSLIALLIVIVDILAGLSLGVTVYKITSDDAGLATMIALYGPWTLSAPVGLVI